MKLGPARTLSPVQTCAKIQDKYGVQDPKSGIFMEFGSCVSILFRDPLLDHVTKVFALASKK